MILPKWKKFENLVGKIQKVFSPDAVVTIDDRIIGKITETKRQVDITIRKKIGQYNILVGIDCKDLSSPVDVKGVEEVIGLIQDIGANKGAIVSASGFTSTALKRGEKAGLDLLRLVDTGNHDWQAYVTVPALCNYCGIKSASFKFQGTGPFKIPYYEDFKDLKVYDINNKLIGTIGDILLDQFYEGTLPEEAGLHKNVDFIMQKTTVKYKEEYFNINITADIFVENISYYGDFPLEEITGFKDDVTGKTTCQSMTTMQFNYEYIEKNWKILKPDEKLAIQPVLTFGFTD